MLFEDNTVSWPYESEHYVWIFDAQLNLLMLFPDPSHFGVSEKKLWFKILKYLSLNDWLAWFSTPQSSQFKSGRFIFNLDSVEQLSQRYQPLCVWYFGNQQNIALPHSKAKFLTVEHYQDWLKVPMIQKKLW